MFTFYPRSLVQTCWLETTALCLNTRFSVNKNFQILITYIDIKVTVWRLCAQPIMTSLIFDIERPNNQ